VTGRCRHPRIVAGACRLYGLAIWLYPPTLRREFQHELLITFRNRTEDVLNTGGGAALLRFAVHIGIDWLRTFATEADEPPPLSLLGLGSGDEHAYGCIDRTTFSVSLMLATLGVMLLVGGWYGWLQMYADIVRHHRPL
jgi:hypothetical protein